MKIKALFLLTLVQILYVESASDQHAYKVKNGSEEDLELKKSDLKNANGRRKNSLFDIFRKAHITSFETDHDGSTSESGSVEEEKNLPGLFELFRRAHLEPEHVHVKDKDIIQLLAEHKNVAKRSVTNIFQKIDVVSRLKSDYITADSNSSDSTNNASGIIASPGFPNVYPVPISVNHTVLLDPRLGLELKFDAVDTRYQADFIKITLCRTDYERKAQPLMQTTLVLSGTFRQPLKFYAKYYDRMQLEFFTTQALRQLESYGSSGFLLRYTILQDLDKTEGLLLSGDTTVMMSEVIRIPTQGVLHSKRSFCDTLDRTKELQDLPKCKTEKVEKLLLDKCNVEVESRPCMQIICSTTLNSHYSTSSFQAEEQAYVSVEAVDGNPYEYILVYLAAAVGTVIVIVIISLALIQADVCGMQTKFFTPDEENEKAVIIKGFSKSDNSEMNVVVAVATASNDEPMKSQC